jgi:hypothetical protein
MYWFRSPDASLLPWLAVMFTAWLGGWLAAAGAFRLERRERLLAGFALGLALFLFTANLIGRWVLGNGTFIGAALIVLGTGFLMKGRQPAPWGDWVHAEGWRPVVGSLILGGIILQVFQGVAIFDEFVHVPLISTMAAGDIPPRYFINSRVLFAYHYGFHLLGASLVRLGGLFPWSAADLAKAVCWGAAVMLAWLLGRRTVANEWGGALAAAALVFAGGARWLLLLAPHGLLLRADSLLALQGDEAAMGLPFSQMLGQYWRIEGQPPTPFIFGYQGGIAEPYIIQQTGPNTLSMLIFLLAWLLAGRGRDGRALPILVAVFALWALTAETSYGMFALGGALAWLIGRGTGDRGPENPRHPSPVFGLNVETAALILSGGAALIQGGVLTEVARGLLGGGEAGAAGFSLRASPVILSKHLGALSLFSPLQVFIALLELGPLFWAAPWLTVWAWRKFRAGEWVFGALALGAWISFAIPIFVDYHSGPDISRVTAYGMSVWAVMLGMLVMEYTGRWEHLLRPALAGGLALACFGGVMLAASLLTAAPQPILTGGLTGLDAQAAAALWDSLPAEAEVFDPIRWRAPALTARPSRAVTGNQAVGYAEDADWASLEAAPTVEALLANGYRFVYVDERWWQAWPEASRADLSQGCVTEVIALDDAESFRKLLDLGGCPG